ncbi:adenylyl-sulfate kinase [Paenibacillus filicis]|uniref:Adenylyl-sulfate kinase n=1 Tax=Paenibacillus filicis TaxID=669464 RepID=A0ABU9DRD9_9BACL
MQERKRGKLRMTQQGVTVWLTGLSGAGKTTIAKEVNHRLLERSVPTEYLDGDELRQTLCKDLGFSEEDRHTNIERVTFVAKLLTKHGVICLAAFISPYEAMRELARREIGSFVEVFVTAPLKVLIERDTKGLYKKALRGEITDFTGIQAPYEAPRHPDLVLETDRQDYRACADAVIRLLEERGYLPKA